ncbi:MAG: TIGR00153 family protein [Pseudomonadales bacterium]
MNQRADIFSRLFGESLISPIKKHMAVCHETAQTLLPFFAEVFRKDYDAAHQYHLKICELEQQADSIKKEVRLHLPTGLLMAVSRNDLLELIRAQDKIANRVRDVAGLVCGRGMRIPEGLESDFELCVERAIAPVRDLNDTMHNLDTLVGTGFIQSRNKAIEAGVDRIDDGERLSDQTEHHVRQRLYQIEDSMDPIDVMFLYKVIDLLGDIADRTQVVANRIRIIIAN